MLARYSLIRPGRRVVGLHDSLPGDVVEVFKRRGILPRKRHTQRGHRLRWDRPAHTMTTHAAEEWIHPSRNRPLTVRECARIQGFPDGYEFLGPLTLPHNSGRQDVYAQLGDSVCPPVARAWAKVLQEILS
jgi:DNA (cytosine-5)-methyltransferase 1